MAEAEATDPGFRQFSRTPVFEGVVFGVDQLEVLDPDGRPFQRAAVRHPGAVAVVAVDASRRVTLVRQYRAAVDRSLLEAPAGTCDVDHEPLERTAHRELAEEAGLTAEHMVELIATLNSPGISDQCTTIFLATGLAACAADPVGIEEGFMTIETVDLDDVDRLVAEGVIVDETTVLGMLLARVRLGPRPGG